VDSDFRSRQRAAGDLSYLSGGQIGLAPRGVKVWSAGSEPTTFRPEAVAVMGEIGIDIAAQRAKSVGDIPVTEVVRVVTLCAERCARYTSATRCGCSGACLIPLRRRDHNKSV
jgi:protein-tyrosine-phosphatase